MNEQTVREQSTWEHYKLIEAENYHLKRQLANKNKEIKRLKRIISTLKENMKQDKQRYRNNGKAKCNLNK
ncbi:hypothetical protein [Rummeliibacillus pycnus]|uniref:hypothetical protein n=1 Tax=Rummeliibacillus pycnus TaxID=101070 RepID=UPI003D27F21A